MSFDVFITPPRQLSRISARLPARGLKPKSAFHGQSGFSLIEISIVTTIMMLLAIVGIPAIQGYVVESKVPRVAEELQRFVARLKVTTHGFGASPYAGVDTRVLAILCVVPVSWPFLARVRVPMWPMAWVGKVFRAGVSYGWRPTRYPGHL